MSEFVFAHHPELLHFNILTVYLHQF